MYLVEQQHVLLLQIQVLAVEDLLDCLVFGKEIFAFVYLALPLDVLASSVVGFGLSEVGGISALFHDLGGELWCFAGGVAGSCLLKKEGLCAGCIVGGMF